MYLRIFVCLALGTGAFAQTPTPPSAAPTTPAKAGPAGASAPSEDTAVSLKKGALAHPGLLHNEEDFARMRSHIGREPWKSGWEKLIANRHSHLDYRPRPVEVVVRGRDAAHTETENYALLFNDIAAAYACALRWRISGDQAYAEKSVEILNAWSSTLKKLSGSTDLDLAAGV
jgi:hypothetical protein